MAIDEIILPETKPETEWILGGPVQKVSPRSTHGVLQGAFHTALSNWAGDRGRVGTEIRFRIAPAGDFRRPLVPDVSFLDYSRTYDLTDEEFESPPLSPDVAVEILSPDDRRVRVDHKIGVYLAGGSLLVIIVDPSQRRVELHDGETVRIIREDGVLTHEAIPGFALPLAAYFRMSDRPRRPS